MVVLEEGTEEKMHACRSVSGPGWRVPVSRAVRDSNGAKEKRPSRSEAVARKSRTGRKCANAQRDATSPRPRSAARAG